MKAWQKGFLGGMILGGIGMMPVLWWSSDLELSFHCPSCDARLTVHKKRGEIAPHISSHKDSIADEPRNSDSDAIVAAPTA